MIGTLIQVALGGAIGAMARYLSGVIAVRLLGRAFPWGTLAVNIIGSFLMGVLIVVLAEKFGNRFAPFLMTGVLGGFTTFSAFSMDAVTIFQRGDTTVAALYVLASVFLSLLAVFVGLAFGRMVL